MTGAKPPADNGDIGITDAEQRRGAKAFATEWAGRGYEKSQTQLFWFGLLRSVLGVPDPEHYIIFEDEVEVQNKKFIDARIPKTRILVEQKSLGVDLNAKQRQSDGVWLTPLEQAKRYVSGLRLSEHPRYIVICNFSTFLIYDCESRQTELLQLSALPREYYRLNFLVDCRRGSLQREMMVSMQAGELVGKLYDAIHCHYLNPDSDESLRSLNMLCVRLVFCLYAEDAGIFGRHNQFHDYLVRFEARDLRRALIDLFRVLDTRPEMREGYLDADLAAFPYVNGGLFADESIEIPQLDDTIKEILLTRASLDFDWSQISPTIFGAVFESTLNPQTRRSGGMHYTSIENIHKVIDPLFLDALKDELEEIRRIKVIGTRRKRLLEYQDRLSSLTFLDPACGSGNFLTETYLCLRRLENEVLILLNDKQMLFNLDDVIKVGIRQFYGIEINDFAVAVARTALWISENQMMKATEDIVQRSLDFLPLKSYANIVEGDAVTLDWNQVVSRDNLSYIIGNPPFAGARIMDATQKGELLDLFRGVRNAGNLDFVSCWYRKAADYMHGTGIRAALVSTNSITQGEQVAILWKPLFARGIRIQFAYRTFRWDSEAALKAHVHCVIIGFGHGDSEEKCLYDEDGMPSAAAQINPYLVDAPAVFIESRTSPLCDVPEIGIGNKPIDGGNYLFTQEEMEGFIRKEPASRKYFHPWYGAEEFIARKPRYCLWLGDAPQHELIAMPECMKRVKAVHELRLASKSAGTVKLASRPTRFHVENMPAGNYLLIPSTSSERRVYIPIGFMEPGDLASNATLLIPDATHFHFGVLTSSVHMAWTRAVCGRLKSDFRYSKDIVYNNFPWPDADADAVARISGTAQAILEARRLYPECSYAELYGENMYLFPELLSAHQANDRAVLEAYGFAASMTGAEIAAALMQRWRDRRRA